MRKIKIPNIFIEFFINKALVSGRNNNIFILNYI
jgi:hypothetical protein